MKSENEELSTLFKYIHNRSERDENKDSDIQNLYHFLKNAYFDFLMLKRVFSHVFLNLGIVSIFNTDSDIKQILFIKL